MNLKIFFFLFCISISGFSQQKATISGKVTIDNIILPDAIIELQIRNISKYAVADKKGIFKFSNLLVGDTIVLKLKYLGYKPFTQKVENLKVTNQIDINLSEIETEELKEIVITSKDKIINTARKSSYKIDQNDFIKNAKSLEVLNSIPNVFVKDGNSIVDGTLTAIVFIDGIESMKSELDKLEASDIDKVEVMNNPSAVFGSDFTGAVINIITKLKTQEFIKGAIGASGGLRNNKWALEPSISYKRGIVIFKSNFTYLSNNQNLHTDLFRKTDSDVFQQKSYNASKGFQKALDSRLNIKLSEKSNFNISNSLFGYKFNDNLNGISVLNNATPVNYSKNGYNSKSNWNINSVYKYAINENKSFFIKAKYYVNNEANNEKFLFSDATPITNFNIESQSKEFSLSTDYEVTNLKIFKKNFEFYSGLKYINRNFNFSNTDFYVTQNVFNIYNELDINWTKKFTTDISFIFENTRNFNKITLNQKYNFVLPTINGIYHFKDKLDAKFGYLRKILRPSPNYLNDQLYILNPNYAKQGNSNLAPQLRNYYYFSFNKAIKSNNFSLKFYNESINNFISETFKLQGNLLVQTPENVAKYNSTGINLGIRTKLFKKINANINSGFDYNVFDDKSPSSIIKKNDGYTFRGNINLNTNLFKDKLSVSFSGFQNGPTYSLLSKSVFNPYFGFSLTTNVFKDKLNISLIGDGIFANTSNINLISNYANFHQNIGIKNNTSNLVLSLSYNFGKKFNDRIDDNNIQNNDLK